MAQDPFSSDPRTSLASMNTDYCYNCNKMRNLDSRNLCQFCDDLFPEYLPKEQIKKFIHMQKYK